MRKIIGLFVIAGLLAMASAAAAQESQPAPSPAPQAPTYEQFQASIAQLPQVWATQLASRLELDVQQQQIALRLLQQRTAQFLQDNGRAMFDVVTRGQEMARLVSQSKGDWSAIPEDTRKEMADKGAAMMDLVSKEASDFADKLRPTLRPEQQQKLDEDRARMQQRMEEGKAKLQALVRGEAPPEPAAAAAGQADAAPAAPAAPAAKAQAFTGGPGNPDNWERYVQGFCATHKLDEVQKVQAMDILKKYQEKAKALPPSEPVAAPAAAAGASQPAAEEIARRMAARSKPFVALFGQMKAELDQIPTPVQKQLAGEGSTSAPSSRPSMPPSAASQAQGQAK